MSTSLATQQLVDLYLHGKARPSLQGQAGLCALQDLAMKDFQNLGAPRKYQEAWRYTDLARIMQDKTFLKAAPGKQRLTSASAKDALHGASCFCWQELKPLVVTFVNGVLCPEASHLEKLPHGVSLTTVADMFGDAPELLREMLARDARLESQEKDMFGAMVSLNRAFVCNGIVLRVGRGVRLASPLVIRHLTGGEQKAVALRHVIHLEDEAKATVIQSYGSLPLALPSKSRCFVNAVNDLTLKAGADLVMVKTQEETNATVHINTVFSTLATAAKLHDHTAVLGDGITRNQSYTALQGEQASLNLATTHGLYGQGHSDVLAVVDHEAPNCTSNTQARYVLEENATGVFYGKVMVPKGADGTQATQQSKTLMLSNDTTMNNRPELAIFADDVQCAHGATIGEMDKDMLFFMRARGLSLSQAKRLLVAAFLQDPLPPLSAALFSKIFAQAWQDFWHGFFSTAQVSTPQESTKK